MRAVCFEATVCLLRELGHPPTLLSHITRPQRTSDLPPASPAPGSASPARPRPWPTAQGSQQLGGLLPGERLGQAALPGLATEDTRYPDIHLSAFLNREGLPNVFMVWRENKVFEKQ